jgi:hypothetical protein
MNTQTAGGRWTSRRFWLAVGSILLVTVVSVWLYSDLRGLLQTDADVPGLAHQAFADLVLALFLRWLGYVSLIVAGYLGIDQHQKRLYVNAGLDRPGGK